MTRNHGRLFGLVWIVIALAAMTVGLIPPLPSAQAQLFGISEQEEIRIGHQVEAELAKTYGFVNDPEAMQRVRGIGLRLAHVSERPNLPWTYHIIADKTVNAIAAPGGFVFVNRGLLSFVKSDDELAFVMGHETTHVAHRHAVELAQQQMELQFGAVLLSRLLFGGSLTAYQLSSVASGLIAAKYSRDKEYEADHYGVIYAKKIGYDPRAALTFFERLRTLEQKPSALGSAFATHPPTPERIKAVRDELRQMGYQVAGPADVPASSAPAPSSTLPVTTTAGPERPSGSSPQYPERDK